MVDYKVALVTGAGTGIGKACAYSFLKRGYAAVIVGRRIEKINEAKEEFLKEFDAEKVLALSAVVSKREDCDMIF